VKTGENDPGNNDPTYCFNVTHIFTPDFVGEGRSECATTVQHLQRKFNSIRLNQELLGGRVE
jgi:hypothetical protein